MKRRIVVAVLVALTTQASADNRDVWKGAFVGSMAMTVTGGYLWWNGTSDIDDARDALCDGGAYPRDPSCATSSELTPMEIDELNAQGERGSMKARIGAASVLVAGGFAVFSFYKGFIAKEKVESKVVVAPTITRGGGGAALQLRW